MGHDRFPAPTRATTTVFRLCGYGTAAELRAAIAAEYGVTVTFPPGFSGSTPCYALFTWNTVGIIDVPSLLAITGEAWVRKPTTIILGTSPPAPDAVTVTPNADPNADPNAPTPTP